MQSFLAIDFETSDYAPNSACSIGLVKVDKGQIVQEFTHLIRPPRKIMRFTDVHGITWQDVEHMPTFGELWEQVEDMFKDVSFLVAHNASFDSRVLAASCEHYNILIPHLSFRCTVRTAKNHFGIKPANLSNVCKVLGIQLNHHEALSDARAAAMIMMRAQKDLDALPLSSPQFEI